MAYTYQVVTAYALHLLQRLPDGAFIPMDANNGDYQTYLSWVAVGNSTSTVVLPAAGTVGAYATTAYVDAGDALKLNISSNTNSSQQVTGTASNLYVTPLVQQSHLSSAKAWVNFNANGTINASYNIASVVLVSTGKWTITYTVPFSTANYVALFEAELSIASLIVTGVQPGTRTTGSIVVSASSLLGVLIAPTGKLQFAAFGAQ